MCLDEAEKTTRVTQKSYENLAQPKIPVKYTRRLLFLVLLFSVVAIGSLRVCGVAGTSLCLCVSAPLR
ncbi:MAG: hypothetical protein C5S47_05950 [Candidatus Methanogasteraceae archaeon]|nr:MAG: hypothetical protein C5S47_05950 [ANME-2 cluster archaeon]